MAITDIPEYAHLTEADVELLRLLGTHGGSQLAGAVT